MKRILLAWAAALALPAAQADTKWDLPSGYAANTFQVQNLQQFADDVAKTNLAAILQQHGLENVRSV